MLNKSFKTIVAPGSAVLLAAALGTHAFGTPDASKNCRDLQTDIAGIRLALGVVDGKIDQSNQSIGAVSLVLGALDAKVDQSNRSSAAILLALGALDAKADRSDRSIAAVTLALGVLDAKMDQSSADLAIVRAELQRIQDTLLAQGQDNGGLQLQVEADEESCPAGAIQCAAAVLPSSSNQIPVELKLLVLRDQVSVDSLQLADFTLTAPFSPNGGADVTTCVTSATGCGSPEFFIDRGNGSYQLWVHPPTENWVSGTYSLLLRVTDADGHMASKLVNVAIGPGFADPGRPPITDLPGLGKNKNPNALTAVN
jgi:hypothetical protein